MKFILTLCITCFLCACVNTTVQEVRERETGIQAGDSVVVIGRNNRPSHEETEIDFVDCVAKDLASGGNALAVVSEQDFKDQTFPWFEPRTAPVNIKELPKLLEQRLLADRLNELGIKYLIWLDGKTQRTSSATWGGTAETYNRATTHKMPWLRNYVDPRAPVCFSNFVARW